MGGGLLALSRGREAGLGTGLHSGGGDAISLLSLGACASTSTTQLPLYPENDDEAIVHIIRGNVVPYFYGLKGSLQKDTAELTSAFKGKEVRYLLAAKSDLARPGLVDPLTACVLLTMQLSRLPLKLMELNAETGKGLMETFREQADK